MMQISQIIKLVTMQVNNISVDVFTFSGEYDTSCDSNRPFLPSEHVSMNTLEMVSFSSLTTVLDNNNTLAPIFFLFSTPKCFIAISKVICIHSCLLVLSSFPDSAFQFFLTFYVNYCNLKCASYMTLYILLCLVQCYWWHSNDTQHIAM